MTRLFCRCVVVLCVPQLVQTHSSADGLLRLMKIYEEEDEAYREFVSVATQFYQNLLQPFRDMREIASLYKTEILKCLQYEELGPKRVCELKTEMNEWSQRGESAVHSIQDHTAEYFKDTSRALTGMVKQMEQDQKRFGHASWAMATPRQEKLRILLAKETLQHMRAKEMCIKRKRVEIREQMRSGAECVSELELQYYETQVELHDCRFDILRNEELLLVTQIQTIQRQITELKEQVVYYDTCEDPDELQDVQVDVSPAQSHLQQQLKHLESKRGAISSRRAYLRNQRELCVKAHEQQKRSVTQRSAQNRQHHAAQLKREKRRAEEEQQKQWLENERAKTLNRVRCFRERHQGQYALNTESHDSSRDDSSQPLSIISLGPQSSTPRRKGQSQKHREIPVQILLPSGSSSAKPDQTPPPPPPLLSPPPPPPPPPPPLLLPLLPLPLLPPPAPQTSDKLPMRNTLEQNSGSMDELLASLQRGQKHLRKVEVEVKVESGDVRDNLLSAIRQGVALKKAPPTRAPPLSSDSELERSIKAAMLRMKKVSNDSDDEERSDSPTGDWES
ncbi:unnamed protein product [Leuciscus chuanchicus]